nr:hypothetical protein VIGAN_04129500 [Ipomoea trifida]
MGIENVKMSRKEACNPIPSVVVSSAGILGDLRQRLEVTFDDSVDEDAGFVSRVSRRDINNVGLHDGGRPARVRVEGGDGAVVGEAVVAVDDAEADDVALLVEDLEPLGAAAGGEAGDDADLAEGAHVAVPHDDVAALHEVLVGLRVVEAADHGPNGGDGGGDPLDHGGAALVGSHRMGVIAGHRFRDLRGRRGARYYRR